MNDNQLLFVLGILFITLIPIIMGFVLLKKPPKKINDLYGYRTKNSMKSQEQWDYAQRKNAKEFIRCNLILLTSLSVVFFIPEDEVYFPYIFGILMLLFAGSFIIPIVRTERALKNKFRD
ncbi:MAG: SdpI family protein [Mesonia hippocampi]|uniref:SdpI family protein n=1 Tax=Mesonia hippocampi TaxID=1628250 RepID=UPI003F9DD8EE